MKNGISLSNLALELERRAEAKQDLIADTRQLTMDNDGLLEVEDVRWSMSDIAHNQVANRTGIPVKYYKKMQASNGELLAANVNHWFHSNPEERMLRTLDGQIRAVLSNKYKRIENEHIAGTVLPVLLEQDGVDIASCNVTDSNMYIKAVFTQIQAEVVVGDVVQAGVVIKNSEVGLGSASILPFINRLVCLNGMWINDMKFAAKHIGARADATEGVYELLTDETKEADDHAIMLKIRDVVKASFDEVRFEKYVNKMRDAKEDRIEEDPVEAVKVLGKKENLSEGEQSGVLRQLIEGADLSRYGLMNAVTRHSQDIESYDRATDLEGVGGKILMYSRNEFEPIRRAA